MHHASKSKAFKVSLQLNPFTGMCTQLVRVHPVHWEESWGRASLSHAHVLLCLARHMRACDAGVNGCAAGIRGGVCAYWHVTWCLRAHSARFRRPRRAWSGRVGVAACCQRPAARARRLFCNEIYNYNCKLTLSSGPESRSYGISINYRFNLRPMSTVRTIDHMIDSGSRQGYESNNIAGRERPLWNMPQLGWSIVSVKYTLYYVGNN